MYIYVIYIYIYIYICPFGAPESKFEQHFGDFLKFRASLWPLRVPLESPWQQKAFLLYAWDDILAPREAKKSSGKENDHKRTAQRGLKASPKRTQTPKRTTFLKPLF